MHSNKSFHIAIRIALVVFVGITLLSGVISRVSGFSLTDSFFQIPDSTSHRVSGVEKNRLRSVDGEMNAESSQPMLITNGGTITSFNTPLTENFDTLATTGTANTWTDNVTIPGAYATATQYRAGDGSDANGALYSFGSTGSTDRALGSVGASGTQQYYAFRFTNSTGQPIGAISVSFVGEQWRAAEAANQILDFEYFVGFASDANSPSTGWTSFDALDFASPIDTAAGPLDGNAAANRTALSATLSFPIPVASGQTFWIRWIDLDSAGNDHGLAIDDVVVTATERVVTYTTAGAGTFFVPSGVTTITVEGWGGGGGGAGDGNTGSPRGGGGGGGAYSRKVLTVTPGASLSYTVGAAGTAGNGSNGSGGFGGDTFFIDAATFKAAGGNRGNVGSGGLGGQINSSVGDVRYSGGNGDFGFSTGLNTGNGGGGGGSAGPLGNGNNAPSGGDNSGAAAVADGGPGGEGGICDGRGNPPFSGPGGGGGGGCDAGPTSQPGGAGFSGQLRIRYTAPAPAPTTQSSNITFSGTAATQATANWTSGNGVGRVVYVNTTNSFTAPANGTSPTANTVYSGAGQQVVYNGSGSSVTVTGLSASTTYYFRVYEYNGTGSTTAYNTATATGNPNTVTTLAIPTAGSVSIGGRVMVGNGRGLANARVYLIDQNGETRLAMTNPFGYYRLDGIAAGQSVVIMINSKSFSFAPQIVSVTESLEELNFFAEFQN